MSTCIQKDGSSATEGKLLLHSHIPSKVNLPLKGKPRTTAVHQYGNNVNPSIVFLFVAHVKLSSTGLQILHVSIAMTFACLAFVT